ncbi:nuclear transport factor 2 family protein [Rhodococcus sp. USK10]|uniref:Nuclear transport factor 2 family protein n=1 Tax=Rhodococcus pseudokoreensis TaxID=2811421 RepID=A0A974WAB7_9NOCA|nr:MULTISPECIES: limonene-1,2-epoxide hydrolase family protein [Rhodococcus]QSE94058.1 nuclear transport factor 2 family protein [Rhodococcus pseudokoreensis]QYB05522.1 nuclear transport factor 2 family protein [Rhodococcus sp. USK10]
MTPDQLVTQFCAEWIEPDPAKIAEYFADDAVYHNIPMEPVIGRDAIREFIAGFIVAFGGIDFRVHRQVTDGGQSPNAEESSGVVMNERIDVFTLNGIVVELPVVGVFEITDGKITTWRDYFDMAPIQAAAGGG